MGRRSVITVVSKGGSILTLLLFYSKILELRNQIFYFYTQHMEVALLTVVGYICITSVGTQQGSHKYRSLGKCFKKRPAHKRCG